MRKPRRIGGTCIAGTELPPDDTHRRRPGPLVWWRNTPEGFVRFVGRQNRNPAAVAAGHPKREFACTLVTTNPIETCRSCPAYRYPAGGYTGMWKGEPLALTDAEHELLLDDLDTFYAVMDQAETMRTTATLARTVASIEDLPIEAQEYRRGAVRRWRAAHPGADKRKRSRAEYMRQYRKRNPKGPAPPVLDSRKRK